MLRIRFSRHGKKNHATYRIIVSERAQDTHGRYIELLGHVNPHTKPSTVDLKEDRITYWISKGAQPSDTVRNLLIEKKVIDGKKIPTGFPKKKEGTEAAASATPAPEAPKTEEKQEEPKPEAAPEPEAVAEKKEEPKAEESKPA